MIGLDTNVLVRYLTQDDLDQGKAAVNVIEGRCTRDEPGYVSLLALCELVWVLRRAYGYDREVIGTVLEQILSAAELQVENEDVAWYAAHAYQTGPADFADYAIVQINERAGCEKTYSFDKDLAKHNRVELPD